MAAIFTRQSSMSSAVRADKQSRPAPSFSFSRLLSIMSTPHMNLDGLEREYLDEIRRASDGFYNQQRFPLPLQMLSDPTIRPDVLARDMSKGTPSAGGYLVGTETSPVADLLRPWSVAAQAGITVLGLPGTDRIAGDLVIPKVGNGITPYWLSTETTAITPSDPTTEKLTLAPKTGGALTKYSRLLARQGNVADALLQREMLRCIGIMLDTAILAGTGINGQPKGITNTLGIATGSGAFNWLTACTMEQTAADQGADDSRVGYLSTPAVRKLLKNRTVDVGLAGEQLWKSGRDGDLLAGRPAHVASYAPADTVICGPWSDCVLAMWGVPVLEINPNDPAGFKAGTIEARMLIDCDVGLLHSAAWTVHSSTA